MYDQDIYEYGNIDYFREEYEEYYFALIDEKAISCYIDTLKTSIGQFKTNFSNTKLIVDNLNYYKMALKNFEKGKVRYGLQNINKYSDKLIKKIVFDLERGNKRVSLDEYYDDFYGVMDDDY